MNGLSLVTNFAHSDPRAHVGLANKILEWRKKPVACVQETFERSPSGGPVVVDPQQAKILEAVAAHDRVAARTGRGVGKTTDAAFIVHWWLTTRYPALAVTSAGTWGHLEDKLWPEIRLWGREWLLRESFEYQQMGIYNIDRPEALRVEATSSDRAVNVEGFHSPHLLLLIDEAKGMPDEIFAALLASLTGMESGGEQKIVALSTPPLSRQGWFARVSSSTEWNVVHISGFDSPRVSRDYIREIAETFGEDSPEYQAYVLGEIPEGVSETVIPMKWFEDCQQLGPSPQKKTTRKPVLTCDVAREGDDLTAIGVFDCSAFSLVKFEDRFGWFSHLTVPQVIGRCKAAAKFHPSASAICIDDTGLGGGVTDGLRDAQSEGQFPSTISIIAIKFGGRPSLIDRFKNRKDELWWASREAIRQHRIALPTDDDIRAWKAPRGSDFKLQMTSAIYGYDVSDRIDVIDKRKAGNERSKTLPTKSPDLAHAFILGIRYYMRQTEDPEVAEPPRDQGEALYRRISESIKRESDSANPAFSQDPYRRRH